MKNFALLSSLTCGLASSLAVPSQAQSTTRASVGTGGIQGDSHSTRPELSASGRYVAFDSTASNLVPGDTNLAVDVFVRDRLAGLTIRASVDSAGAEGDGDSYYPALSANGRYVAFWSQATNLVPLDTNLVPDVFVHDLALGTTVRVSVDSQGAQGNSTSRDPSISGDGRFVAFISLASNLVPDMNGGGVFVHDLVTGATIRASVSSLGAQANSACHYPSISGNGRFVVFHSWATNLVPLDTNGMADVFVRDLVSSTTIRASVDSAGAQASGGVSEHAALSADGLCVAFESRANNLVSGDTNFGRDVFVHELETGSTTRVSVSSSGGQGGPGSPHSTSPALSHNGRFVAFLSEASNLVPDDTNGRPDVFLHDRLLGTTTRVSLDSSGGETLSISFYPSISGDGRHVAFASFAAIVPSDTNGVADVFVRSSFHVRPR